MRTPLRLPSIFCTTLLALGLAVPSLATSPDESQPPSQATRPAPRHLDPDLFPVPHNLRPNVEFWLQVYTRYDHHVRLLHDEKHLGVIYAALDFREIDSGSLSESRKRRIRRQRIEEARTKYKTILRQLAAGKVSSRWPQDQERVEAMFAAIPGGNKKYTAALGRLRTQTCLRDRFAEAIERSGYFMPTMERMFQDRGLPIELTRLPFVESLFQWRARSSAAAGGIWQFVPSTARFYLDMTAEIDERYDPLLATDAAARFLGENHEALKTWPLAITAYNHGRAGMKRAVRRLGTRDLGTIAETYKSRTFGFASRNFYAEFVAAWRAYEGREHYFPNVQPHPLLEFDELVLDQYVALPSLMAATGTDADTLRLLNPGLTREVWAGHLYWPKSRKLRIPANSLESFQSAFTALDSKRKSPHQVGLRYTVRRGDTLGAIARRFGTSVRALRQANRISGHLIRVGQRLLVPPSARGARQAAQRSDRTASAVPKNGVHTVRRGETLSRIAGRYGTSSSAIQQLNGLARPDHLRVGQRLQIPAAQSGVRTTHVVQRGETLATIARRYGTSVKALQRLNRLANHIIHPAQVLLIP